MNFRLVCQYLPDAQVCAVARKPGAWRLLSCSNHNGVFQREAVKVITAYGGQKFLLLYSHRKRQANTWVNPRTVLREWLAQREPNAETGHNYTLADYSRCEPLGDVLDREPLVLGRGG